MSVIILHISMVIRNCTHFPDMAQLVDGAAKTLAVKILGFVIL